MASMFEKAATQDSMKNNDIYIWSMMKKLTVMKNQGRDTLSPV